MGTYGVTHIKKDDKIIPFSDSYDGYWSGMGLANLIGLKYISIQKLGELFDSFSARQALSQKQINNREYSEDYENNDDEFSLNQRQIQSFIDSVKLDTDNNTEAHEWAESIIKGDIRTSSVGVVPLLYMNIHPHYGYNYDYADYVIDLNKKVFHFTHTQLEIPLIDIQNTTVEHLMYLMEDDFSLIKHNDIEPIVENGIREFLYSSEESHKNNSLQMANLAIQRILSIPHKDIVSFYEQKEAEREQYYKSQKTSFIQNFDDSHDDNSYSYSIYSTECSSATLRKVIFFLQEKLKEQPFLLDCVEWGLDENYINGGLRLVSPKNSSQYEVFNTFVHNLESHFKLKFNIFSGAGFGLVNEEDTSIHKSLFSFEELKTILTPEDYSIVMEKGLPYLAYHSNIDEAISFIISQNGNTYSPVFWTFVSLVKQNETLFNLTYPQALEQIKSFEESDTSRIKTILVNSFYDGIQLNELFHSKNDNFVKFLMKTDLFKYCQDILNETEKSKYLKHNRFNM